MAAGHLLPHQSRRNQKVNADMDRKHRKWPLGTPVWVNTPDGYMLGRVFKHWLKYESGDRASIEFPVPVDMGDANGRRFCHEIPFRSMKRADRGYRSREDMTRQALEDVLAKCRVRGYAVPAAFAWENDNLRQGVSQEVFEREWPGYPLEKRIGLVARLLDGPVHASPPSKLITTAYERLCSGQLKLD